MATNKMTSKYCKGGLKPLHSTKTYSASTFTHLWLSEEKALKVKVDGDRLVLQQSGKPELSVRACLHECLVHGNYTRLPHKFTVVL